MTEAALNRRAYSFHSLDDWADMEALYRAGATARSIAAEYNCSERKIYVRAREYGWLRRDMKPTRRKMTREAAEAKARAISGVAADAPVRGLSADADLAAATRAAVRTTVGMLRDGETARAYAFGRLAALMLRLERALDDSGRGETGGPSPQDEAAMAFILERLGEEG